MLLFNSNKNSYIHVISILDFNVGKLKLKSNWENFAKMVIQHDNKT